MSAIQECPVSPSARLKGRIRFSASLCEGCRQCESVCPANAISFFKDEMGLRFALWHDTCVLCGTCAERCPADALEQTGEWNLVHLARDQFAQVEEGLIPNQTCAECGRTALASNPPKSLVASCDPPLGETEMQELRARCPRCRNVWLRNRKAAGAAPAAGKETLR